jgi:hypothetical protein
MIRLIAIKEIVNVTNKFLNSYSAGRDNTKARQIPPLNHPKVRIFCQ